MSEQALQQQEAPKENKMGVQPVGKLIVTMSWPLIASMLFQALYNIVDSMFVAMLNQDALNAVSLVFPLQMLVIAFASGTGIGMNAMVSRFLGAKDHENANKSANTAIFMFGVTAVFFAILSIFIAKPYFAFLTENPHITSYGIDYVAVCFGCSFALLAQICEERLLQSTGRTKLSMVSQITGAVINMILDPILIFGLCGMPRLEVKGAAIATVIGQICAATVGFTLNVKKNKEIKLSPRLMRFNKKLVAQIYKIALPTIIMQATSSVMNFLLNDILIGFTEAATAAFGAYYKIQSFIFMPVFGLNQAIVPILSYNYGAKKPDRVKKAIKISVLIAVSIMTVGLILFETIPGTLISIFSPTEEMLRVGIRAFRIIALHFPVAGFCIISITVSQALGKPIYSLITSVARQIVVLLPAAYLLSLTGVLDNVWYAFLIAEVMSLICSVIFMRRAMKHAGAL